MHRILLVLVYELMFGRKEEGEEKLLQTELLCLHLNKRKLTLTKEYCKLYVQYCVRSLLLSYTVLFDLY